jgi:hypothetical protein
LGRLGPHFADRRLFRFDERHGGTLLKQVCKQTHFRPQLRGAGASGRPKNNRGFRPIVVDEVRYRWRFGEFNRTADLEVYLETDTSARGQRLCSDRRVGMPMQTTGKVVAQIIREALAAGWRPNEVGGDFRFTASVPST